MARTPVAMRVVRLASRSSSTEGMRSDRDASRANSHAPPFSAHPVFGPARATRVRSVRPATASRDDMEDIQARIRRGSVLASVRPRLQRQQRASPRASRAVSRGSSTLMTRPGALRSRSVLSRPDSSADEKNEDRPETSAARTPSRPRASSLPPRSKRAAGSMTLVRLAPGTWRATRREHERSTTTRFSTLRLDAAVPPTFSKHASRLRAAHVSVPRPTPRGDETWLARRMKEVGDWQGERRGFGSARFSLEGVVGCAATRGAGSDGFARNETHRRTRGTRGAAPVSTRARLESGASVIRAIAPPPLDPSKRRRAPDRRCGKGLLKGPSNDDDDEGLVRETSTRVDRVFAAAATAWDVTADDSDSERAERASLESLRATLRATRARTDA